jgi:hypothetical protein
LSVLRYALCDQPANKAEQHPPDIVELFFCSVVIRRLQIAEFSRQQEVVFRLVDGPDRVSEKSSEVARTFSTDAFGDIGADRIS